MRRYKQELTQEECDRVLGAAPRGVLAVLGDEGYPYALPIDFIYEPEAKRIYFHGAREGHKLDAIRRCDKVSFCVMDEGFRQESEWALRIKSVIVFGRLRPVEDAGRSVEICRNIALKYYPDAASAEEEVRKDASRALCLELSIEHMTGKLVKES